MLICNNVNIDRWVISMNIKKITILLCIIILTVYKIGYCSEQNDNQNSKFVEEITSDQLKATKITPIIDEKINSNENLIFCSTFQMVWNEMCNKYADGTLEIVEAPKFVEKLNNLYKQTALLDESSYIAMSGLGGEGIVQNINEAVSKKFGFLPEDELPPKFDDKLESNEIMAFSFLYKNLKFNEAFDVLEPILMNNNNNNFYAEAFGIKSHQEEGLFKQIKVIYFNDETDEVNRPLGAIIRLNTKSESDEIIISTIPASNTLLDSYNKIFNLTNQNFTLVNEIDSISIPKLNFNILHEYSELLDKEILNKTLKKYMKNCYIGKAIQKIALCLNEKGAKIVSYAIISFKGYTYDNIVIKCPFIIYFKHKNKDLPYFMAYVNNQEVLVKCKPLNKDK